MTDEAFDRVQLWASQLDPSDPLAIDLEEVLELARIGAGVKPRPIAEALSIDESFIAFVCVHNNETGKEWVEKHLVWIDEDTGEIAVDCDQGWRLEDYESFIPLSALPKPESAP